jgi:hypothetical protein
MPHLPRYRRDVPSGIWAPEEYAKLPLTGVGGVIHQADISDTRNPEQ